MEDGKLSISDMKKIVYDVVNEELGKSDLDFSVFPVTFIEYYSDYVFKKKFSLINQILYSLIPVIDDTINGFNDLNGNSVIFLDKVNRIEKIEDQVFKLLTVCYHEIRHTEQQKFDKNSYDRFLMDIEKFIRMYNNEDYVNSHDKYSYEIGANLYCINKSKEYLKRKYPSLYEKEEKKIKDLEKRYYLDYATYDASDVFNMFLRTIRYNNFRYSSNGGINPILGIFLDGKNNFKKFREIISNKNFNSIDKRIVSAIFSSDIFLKEVDIDALSISELNILYDSLEYMDTIYKNQAKIIGDNGLSNEKYFKLWRFFLEKIKKFDYNVLEKVFSGFFVVRNDYDRLEHVNNVSLYKNNVHKLIKTKQNNET